MRRHISWLAVAVSTLTLLVAVPTTAAAAGPPAPVIVSPDGDTVQSTPVLTWTRVTGAVKYEVTVSAAADFSGTAAFTQTTANVHATPLKDLPVGDWYWRVRGLDSTGIAGPYDTATFTRALDASPVLTSPVDAKTLKYPNEALSYQWEPFAGAKTYELQVDDDPAFIGAAAAISTPNTSYSPTNSPAFDTPVYWRVRAKSVEQRLLAVVGAVHLHHHVGPGHDHDAGRAALVELGARREGRPDVAAGARRRVLPARPQPGPELQQPDLRRRQGRRQHLHAEGDAAPPARTTGACAR